MEELSQALRCEGYNLYSPRSSTLANKTPVPFGVICPGVYYLYNEFVQSSTQTEYIVKGSYDSMFDIRIRFLQVNNNGAGWKVTAREVRPEKISIKELLKNDVRIPFSFMAKDFEDENNFFPTVEGVARITSSEITGKKNTFLVSIAVINKTTLENPKTITTIEVLKHAFISASTIVKAEAAELVSGEDGLKQEKTSGKQNKNEINLLPSPSYK
jgi:hypothetical protein